VTSNLRHESAEKMDTHGNEAPPCSADFTTFSARRSKDVDSWLHGLATWQPPQDCDDEEAGDGPPEQASQVGERTQTMPSALGTMPLHRLHDLSLPGSKLAPVSKRRADVDSWLDGLASWQPCEGEIILQTCPDKKKREEEKHHGPDSGLDWIVSADFPGSALDSTCGTELDREERWEVDASLIDPLDSSAQFHTASANVLFLLQRMKRNTGESGMRTLPDNPRRAKCSHEI